MLTPDVARERYAWADRDHDLSWTMAVVSGHNRADVIRAYGGDPEQEPVEMLFTDADLNPDLGRVSLVHVRQQGPHVLMIENTDWLGVSQGIAERASADGHFICVQWGASGNWLAEARNGKLVANFEPVYIAVKPGESLGELPETWHTFPDWIRDAPLVVGSLRSTMLAIVERQTGLAFDRAWLDEPMPTYRIPYPGAAGAGKSSPVPV